MGGGERGGVAKGRVVEARARLLEAGGRTWRRRVGRACKARCAMGGRRGVGATGVASPVDSAGSEGPGYGRVGDADGAASGAHKARRRRRVPRAVDACRGGDRQVRHGVVDVWYGRRWAGGGNLAERAGLAPRRSRAWEA